MIRHQKVAAGVFIIGILIMLLTGTGFSEEAKLLPTPVEIIAKNIEAIGGINALEKIKNKKIVQIRKYDQMNISIEDTIYQERPNNYYVVMDTGVLEGSNGKMAWTANPNYGKRASLLEGDDLAHILLRDLFDGSDGPDVHYKSMKTEGVEEINGKACYKVVKTPVRGDERTVYYDKKSHMIIKKMRMGGNYKLETYTKEYKKLNGILLPYKTVTFFNGKKQCETTIEKIELNTDMPEGIFDIPEEVKTIMNKK